MARALGGLAEERPGGARVLPPGEALGAAILRVAARTQVPRPESPRPVRFAAVELKPSVPVSESAASRDAMEVILPDERCVRVRAGFDPQALARVLAVLERSAC